MLRPDPVFNAKNHTYDDQKSDADRGYIFSENIYAHELDNMFGACLSEWLSCQRLSAIYLVIHE